MSLFIGDLFSYLKAVNSLLHRSLILSLVRDIIWCLLLVSKTKVKTKALQSSNYRLLYYMYYTKTYYYHNGDYNNF